MRSVCLQCEPQCSNNTLHIMMMWSLQAYQKCKQLETSFVTIHPYNHPPSTIIGLVALVKSVSSTHMDAYWIIARWSWSLWRQSQLRAKVHPLRPVISGDCVMRNGISLTCGGCIYMYTAYTFIHEMMSISGKWHNLYPESPKTKLCPMVVGNPLHELS